jgi:hypothetical protein
MQRFLNSKSYGALKTKYEKEYFKLGGEYAWYDGDKIVIKSTAKIAEHFKNKKVEISEEKENSEGEITVVKKTKTFYQVWSEDPKMKEYNEVIFNCNQQQVKPYQFNLFDGFHIEKYQLPKKPKPLAENQKGLDAINEHFKSLCNYNEEHVSLVKWFIAHMLKKPHELPPICLVFISKEGVGKDLLFDFIENMMGDKYTFNVDKLDKIVGKFNSTMGGKILGVINETDPVDTTQRRDNIKYVITAKKMLIEGKHKDAVRSNNYCRLMFFSNRLTAFPIEKGSRRPYIIYTSEKYLPEKIGAIKNKKHFDALAKVIADPEVQKMFYDELMKIDVEKFNFKEVNKSELQKILEEASKPVLAEFMSEFVYDHFEAKQYSVSTTLLLEQYTTFLKKRNMKFECSQKNFNTELQHCFKVIKFESCGRNKFKIDIQLVKDILLKEFKITVSKKDGETEKSMFDNGVDKSDKAVTVRAEEHKELQNRYHRSQENNEALQEELERAMKYIRELEKRVSDNEEKETVTPIKKSKSNEVKYTVIAEGVVLNNETGEEQEVTDELIDDDKNCFGF